ncbi:MAG: hypothetical protein WEB02_05645 [Methylophaga sp.]
MTLNIRELEVKNAQELAESLISVGQPHKDSSTRVLSISTASLGLNTEETVHLLNELTAKATKSNVKQHQEKHKSCLKHILNTLAVCAFRFEWLVLPTSPPNFKPDQYLAKLGFDQRRMERCVNILEDEGIMTPGRKGHLGGKTAPSRASQYYPTENTIRRFCHSLYSEPESFNDLTDERLYRFKRFNEEDLPNPDSYRYKLDIIRNYNIFMSEHSWAMKSPSYRSIKDFDCRSGRIFNYYQNLAERRIKIRSRTLIDGHPIKEADFSANHLRMASYFFGVHDLPPDPYSSVAEAAGLTRDQIKRVFTECIGASSLRAKGNLHKNAHIHRIPLNTGQYGGAITTLIGIYPWLENVLFHDYGARLQYLEGEISIEMMHWATQNQIPLIPVHDAYAVRQQDYEVTLKVMHEKWYQIMEKARKDDFINKTQYTTAIVKEREDKAKQGRHRH